MLTKHELASIGDGNTPVNTWTVFMYRVYGIPSEEAYLYNPAVGDPSWQFRRIKSGNKYGEWIGDFRTADEALAALEREVNEEK